MENNEHSNNNNTAQIILTLQIVVWTLAISSIYDGSSGPITGDAMSRGMSKAYGIVFITAPLMLFIFFSNFYLAFKRHLVKRYRILSAVNFIGLVVLTAIID